MNQIAKKSKKSPLLPYGYGINVNYPEITSLKDSSCVAPPFIQTRMTGGADVDTAVLNTTTQLFDYGTATAEQSIGANTCINGDCSLPGETVVVGSGCFSSVTVFTVDYDAPVGHKTSTVRKDLEPLVKYQNSTNATFIKSKRSYRQPARANLARA